MQKWLQGVDAVTRGMMVLTAFCTFAIAFFILIEICARLLGLRFYGTAEYIRNTLIIIVFLQVPFAVRARSMLAVDIFVGMLPPKGLLATGVIGCILGAFFFGAVAWGAWEPAVRSWVENEYEGEGIVDVAAWPAKFSIVIGSLLTTFYYLVRMVEIVRASADKPHSGANAL